MKIKTKRALSMGVSLVMALGMCSFVVHAEGEVAEVNGTQYATLTAAIDAANDGDTITLLGDVDVTSNFSNASARLPISKSLTIDGANYTITVAGRGFGVGMNASPYIDVTFKNVTIENTIGYGRGIDTRGNLGTLTLDNVTINTPGAYAQPLTIGGNQSTAANVEIKDSEILATNNASYAITVFNPVNMTLKDTDVTGWACFNLKAADGSAGSHGSVITVDGGIFTSNNPFTGETNNYGLAKFEDSDGVDLSFKNATMYISSEKGKYQTIAAFENSAIPGNVTLGEGNTVTFTGDGAVFATNAGTGNLTITGGTYNLDPSAYVADGYEAVNVAGVYKVGEVEEDTLTPIAPTDEDYDAAYTSYKKVVDENGDTLLEKSTTVNVAADDNTIAEVDISDFDVESILGDAVAVGGDSATLYVNIEIVSNNVPDVEGSGSNATYTYEVYPLATVLDDDVLFEEIELGNDALAPSASFDITLDVPDELTGNKVNVTHKSTGYADEVYTSLDVTTQTDPADEFGGPYTYRTVTVPDVTHFSQFVLSSTAGKDVEVAGFDSYYDGSHWNLRVIGKLNNTDNVDSYGAWFIPSDLLNANTYVEAQKEYANTDTLTSGNTFVADLMNIPPQAENVSITATLFVIYSGNNVAITDTAATTPIAVKNSTSID